MLKMTSKFPQIIFLSLKRFFNEKYSYRVSALAFTTLLAIVPLVSVLCFFLSWFPVFSNIGMLAESYIAENFMPASAMTLGSYLQVFIIQATHLPIGNTIFLFVTVILLISTIDETLNDIWRCSKRNKNFVVLVSWVVVLIIPLLVGFCIFLGTYLLSLPWIMIVLNQFHISPLIFICLSLFINTVIFSCFYGLILNVSGNYKNSFLSGLIAAFLFEIGRVIFSFYVQRFANFNEIYGAFAIVPIFFIWLYLFWLIVLISPMMICTWHELE